MRTYLLGSGEPSDKVEEVAMARRRRELDRQDGVLVRFGGLETVEAPHASSVQELVLKRVAQAHVTNNSVVSNHVGVNCNGVYDRGLDAIF